MDNFGKVKNNTQILFKQRTLIIFFIENKSWTLSWRAVDELPTSSSMVYKKTLGPTYRTPVNHVIHYIVYKIYIIIIFKLATAADHTWAERAQNLSRETHVLLIKCRFKGNTILKNVKIYNFEGLRFWGKPKW